MVSIINKTDVTIPKHLDKTTTEVDISHNTRFITVLVLSYKIRPCPCLTLFILLYICLY